mgnify:CR=1 FL=1
MTEAARRLWITFCALGLAFTSLLFVVATTLTATSDEQQLRAHHLFPNIHPTDVTEISLRRPTQRFVLKRDRAADSENWRITAPVEGDADAALVENLLRGLERATVQRKLEFTPADRVRWGLNAPLFELSFVENEQASTLRLGANVVGAEASAYVEVSRTGSTETNVYVVGKELTADWQFDLNTLRRIQFLPYGSVEVRGLEGHTPRANFSLERSEQGIWLVTTGRRSVAQRQRIQALFEALVDMDDAAPTDLKLAQASQGADSARFTLTLLPKDRSNPKAVLSFGGECPTDKNLSLAVRSEPDPLALCIQRSFLDRLRLTPEELRGNAPFWLRSDEVEQLRIVSGAQALVLERADKAFVLKEPARSPVALEVGNQRLEAILAVRGEPLPAHAPLLAPITLIELESQSFSDAPYFTESARLGAPDAKGTCLLERASDGALFALSEGETAVLRPDATLLKPLKVLDIPRARIARVSVKGPGFEQAFEQRTLGVFQLLSPKGFQHDASVIDAIVGTLSALDAARWVADTPAAHHGLSGQAAWTLQLSLNKTDPDSAKPTLPSDITLRLGARAPGGYYASVDTLDGVFVLPTSSFETVTAWAFDRGLCQILPDWASNIVIRSSSHKLTLNARGGTWVATDELGHDLRQRAEEVLEALGNLRAEAALHPGPALGLEGLSPPWLTVEATAREAGEAKIECQIGAGDSWRNTSIYYMRRAGTDATFAIARSKAQALSTDF